jgi:hypothetical protein
MSNGSGPTPTPAPAPIAHKDGQAGPTRTNAIHATVKTATLTVTVKNPAGVALKDVEVEVVGTAKKNTVADGTAKFDAVPAETPLNIKARKLDYGPVPPPGGTFAAGEAVVTQTFAKAQTATVQMQLQASYKVDLVVLKPTLTLKHDAQSNLEVKVTPPDAVVDEYRIEIKRASAAAFAAFAAIGHTQKLAPWTAKIAGKFKIRGVAKIEGKDVLSAEKDMEVQFPTYSQIVGDAGVQTAVNAEWTSTLGDCTSSPNQRREHGFWINLNTTTETYEFGTTVYGAYSGPAGGAAVDLPPRPADVPATLGAADTGATYPVASFHAHTATEFRAAAVPPGSRRAVGPSGADNNADNTDDVPGVVYDFVESPAGSGSIPVGHPKTSPAQVYYSAGKTRRSTPP